MIDYTLILTKKYQGSQWILDGDDYEGLTWLSDSKKPTKKELDDAWDSVVQQIKDEQTDKDSARAALLERLGITADEAALLLG